MLSAVQFATRALKAKSENLLKHSMRTSKAAAAIAESLHSDFRFDLSTEEIKTAGLLHDIGKLHISNNILGKAGPLNPDEWRRMRSHPVFGEALITSIDTFSKYARYIRQHHEKADGSGYPDGLTLNQIDPISRIINIADQFAAITENRSYKSAVTSPDIVIAMLQGDVDAFFGKSADKVFDVIYFGMESFTDQVSEIPVFGSNVVNLF